MASNGAIGHHRVGPMQQRRDDEFERESAEVERFALLDDAHVEIGAVGDVFEIIRRDRGADDLRFRTRTE